MQENGGIECDVPISGEESAHVALTLPAGVHSERATFLTADAQKLPGDLGVFDCVVALNLLDRLPDPAAFLQSLPELVSPNGLLILTTPFTWMTAYTPRENWINGHDEMKAILSDRFRLLRHEDEPFLIREHARKFQWSVADVSVWQRLT